MAVALSSLLSKSTAALNGVNPRTKEYALEVVRRAYEKGIYVQITSGLRSFTEQAKLYGQGRATYIYNGVNYGNPKAAKVTQAEPGESIHNFGLAVDFALVTAAGSIHWDITRDMNADKVQDWWQVGQIGKQLGFQWGGDWKSFPDYPHLDFQKGYTLAQLRAGLRPTIAPLKAKDWLEKNDSGSAVTALQKNFNTIGIKVGIDGEFGPELHAAVLKFQRDHKLVADGQFGPASQNALAAELKAAAAKAKEEEKKKAAAEAKKQADLKAKQAAEAKAKADKEKAKGGTHMEENVIILNGANDYLPARKLHLKTGYKLMERAAVKGKVAKTVYVVGGGIKGLEKAGDKVVDLSGNSWEETVVIVSTHLKTLK